MDAKRARLALRMAWYAPVLALPLGAARATVDADVARWVTVVAPPVPAELATPELLQARVQDLRGDWR